MSLYIYYTGCYTGEHDVSRQLLKAALGMHTGAPADSISILTKPGGKPYAPEMPEFSVTHSGTHWACLISDSPCGLDLQLPRRAAYIRIAKRSFTPKEAELVEALGEDLFFRIWTRREALVKASGKSVFSDDVPELLIPQDQDVIKVQYDGAWRVVMDLASFPGLYGAVAWTANGEWKKRKEVPTMRRLDI